MNEKNKNNDLTWFNLNDNVHNINGENGQMPFSKKKKAFYLIS